MRVDVLRLGHRYSRDRRLTTHVGLTARAFGASSLIVDSKDSHLVDSINAVSDNWGGVFKVEYTDSWRKTIGEYDGDRIHLTMYGINVDDAVDRLRVEENKLIIIGGQKVPAEVYDMVDYNIAVGNQPHSEVAALAILLDRIFEGKQFSRDFRGRKKIVPQERGKKVIEDY
jgi:tRNA (cytidine56-2'-O)-methyltransferase